MKRREFLKDSAIAAGTLLIGSKLAEADAKSSAMESSSDSESIKMVEVPGKSFEVVDEWTKVPVSITLGRFLMSSTEITQRQYQAIVGNNPSFHPGENLPVETVTWWDAIRFCNLASVKEQLAPCYDLQTGFCDTQKNGYRLPTDTEWTQAAGIPSDSEANDRTANLGNSNTTDINLLADELDHSGTKPVGSYSPNQYGLYDMVGNVWEWCTDYFNFLAQPQSSYNPAGPLRGLSKIVRGGSFISTTSQWAGEYRRCIEPGYKSRFTGFRVCRTLEPDPVLPAVHTSPAWFDQYNQAPAGYETSTGNLSPLLTGVHSIDAWGAKRKTIREKWLKILGSMDIAPPPPKTRTVQTIEHQNYTAKLMYLQVESDWWEKILVMMPTEATTAPRPVVIVPFYDVDTSAAKNLSGDHYLGGTVDPYAYCAVQKGYIAVAIRWWGESYGEFWSEATANLKLRHPNCTGLGKWVWDCHRLVDYIYTLPQVDRSRIGIIGHSLGGKMSLYGPAFDERIGVVVSNEPGIGLSYSNYDDYWYLGSQVDTFDKSTDNHELIALLAPRPFLLIGGDKYDTAKSWYYINAARPVYQLYGKPKNIGLFNHHTGHRPTPDAVWRMNEWLAHFLGAQA